MKKKIICIGIVSLFLFTSFASASSIYIKNLNVTIIQEKNTFDDDYKISNRINYFELTNHPTSCENNGEVDLEIEGFIWWSPAPWNELVDCYGFQYTITNNGGVYIGDFWMKETVYRIYKDGSEIMDSQCISEGEWFPSGLVVACQQRSFTRELPVGIKFEIESSIDETNLENNVYTELEINPGVTIYGNVYDKDLDGNKKIPDYVSVICDSDHPQDHFQFCDMSPRPGHSFYYLSVPKNPDGLSYVYTVKASIGSLDFKIKKTDPLNELETERIDFVFGTKNKVIENTVQKIVNIFPVLQRFLSHLDYCKFLGLRR